MTTFYIVRHGQTHWNAKELLQGHGDSPLTQTGEQQARALAATFAPIKFDQVFSSDLLRAKRTAEMIVIEKQLAVNTTHLLREKSFGKYEGKSWAQFQAENRELFEKFQSLSAAQQHSFKYAPDMESNAEISNRVLQFLKETAVTYPDKTILVVAHGGTIRAILKHVGKLVNPVPGSIQNTAHIVLQSDGVEFVLKETVGIKFV